ncbi:MAG: Gfo/Idh/MocA family oxidoreductase, partial [Verrucomicrobiota bacterium]
MVKRREFFLSTVAGSLSSVAAVGAQGDGPLRVGVIGHSGRGNYGHGLDTVWSRLPETMIVGVADANPEGLVKAKEKLKVKAGFSDYRTMLNDLKPDIAAVCPRHVDQHRDMILAAIEAGVRGIYCEKPFVQTPAQADDVVTACEAHHVKLAVAHRNAWHPVLPAMSRLIEDGLIGTVLEVRGRGKGDRRGGAEDLWVLGTHVLDLMCRIAGEPVSCSGRVFLDGSPLTGAGVEEEGAEGLGPLGGDELHARYHFDGGLTGSFDSFANDGT